MEWDAEIDATGLLCPLPVLKAQKRLRGMVAGQVLRLTATDPAAAVDVPHFCAQAGHEVLASTKTDTARVWLIRRGAG